MAVMIDDLVTKGTKEPYRMFTSRAEYRLLLREDNADERLMEKGNELGLIDGDTLAEMKQRYQEISAEARRIKKTIIPSSKHVNEYLEKLGSSPIKAATPLSQILKRPELNYETTIPLEGNGRNLDERLRRQVEVKIKYEGYIERQQQEVERFRNLEKIKIPPAFNYTKVHGLSNELTEKLLAIRPLSLGQASRIPGMTPAAISVMMIFLKKTGALQ